MSKAARADRVTTRNDSISLCRDQHAGLYTRDGALRLVVDHPSNAPLLGAHTGAVLVRAAELTVETGDGCVVVYVSRGGTACRVAAARVLPQKGGGVSLTDWQVEAGFEHAAISEDGATTHRITRPA
ncbi:MAG: hypothetical protein EPO55_10950 [Reyranella sp.]|uniref:hypothetical protein n=1 Tax=Reyranella sp. TaxID=1929291 RepID=UPI00121AD6AD|nr:hypothetical protein [Reyranella sp.]TAJ39898.1 MAG: hypothetical protein EPO55_10950 [Reyranella sp.]